VTFPEPGTIVLHQHAEYVEDVVATRADQDRVTPSDTTNA
jgi:hypothetical protein